jgi:hypothetical protein
MTNGVTHPANLTVAPFADDDLDDGVHGSARRLAAANRDARRQCAATIENDAAGQPRQVVRVGFAEHAGFVGALELVTWVTDLFGEVAVIRQDDQAFRVVVESSDGIEIPVDAGTREQIDDGRPALRIRSGAHHPSWLEHQQMPLPGRLFSDPPAIDADLVALGVGFRAELNHRLMVHLDPALPNQLFRRATGRDASMGEDFLEADLHREQFLAAPQRAD